MKIATRTLAFLAVMGLFCSLASAKIFRGKATTGHSYMVDANGNYVDDFSNTSQRLIKSIKFSRSGIIISRERLIMSTNLSGKRTVIKNFLGSLAFDPEQMFFTGVTRDRYIFPKGRANRNNRVTGRALKIVNPKNANR